MTRTARETFLTSGHCAEMSKIAATDAFHVACDYALLAFGEELPNPLDPTAQAQIVGARRVLDILKSIHEKQEPPKPAKTASLNYDVDRRRP